MKFIVRRDAPNTICLHSTVYNPPAMFSINMHQHSSWLKACAGELGHIVPSRNRIENSNHAARKPPRSITLSSSNLRGCKVYERFLCYSATLNPNKTTTSKRSAAQTFYDCVCLLLQVNPAPVMVSHNMGRSRRNRFTTLQAERLDFVPFRGSSLSS